MRTSPSYISAYPERRNAQLACKSFLHTMLRSLVYLKNVVEKSSDGPSFTMEPLFYRRLNAQALEPYLFYLHDKLLRGIRAQDATDVRQTMADLKRVCETANVTALPLDGPEIRSLGDTTWENFIVAESKVNIEKDLKGVPEILPVPEGVSNEERLRIEIALELIKSVFPEMLDEIQVFLNKIRVFDGKLTMGITDVRMYGCMFIRIPRPTVNPTLYYGEHICHEVSHMYLNAAMSIDKIVLNDRSERYKSPLRPDPRPMLGIFHATFVTSRIVQLFLRLMERQPSEEVLEYLEQQLDELYNGMMEIGRYGRLTSTGRNLLAEFEEIFETAKSQPYWQSYDFAKARNHRFGSGATLKPEQRVMHTREEPSHGSVSGPGSLQ